MPPLSLDRAARRVVLGLPDGTQTRLPFLWLKDNDPAGFHPDTQERTADLLSVPHDIAPEAVRLSGDTLEVDWPGAAAPSRYALDWLAAHAPGRTRPDPADVAPVPWDARLGADGIPRADAAALLRDDAALARWMRRAKGHGLSIVDGLADDAEAGLRVARRTGFLRQTNFGTTFEVRSRPDPNNLAYTAEALPLHTDLPNQDLPPGWQFLHCIANAATGGGSIFADGVALSEALRATDPAAFDRLAGTPVPFRFHDADTDIRARKPVIVTDRAGAVTEICYNAHIAAILDLPEDEIEPWYRAYRAFMALTRDPAFTVRVTLAPGEMAVFDNRRVLHGRTAFDPSTGARHLRGCYVDRGEWDSRLRVLSRPRAAPDCAAE